ncbi:C-type lectin domain family 6 member A [Channa argus]|uniref:C-type lectin domain family 6 member A n=1 Tax=Channa argus TaxID=215402 RepID=A0A6G1QW67_CHAAH|nr:C-type lectin domain family 6 member A [Channa argus]
MEDGDQDNESQQAEPHSEKKLPAGRNSSFRVFTVSLGVLYLLILAGIITRYISVTIENNQLHINFNKLSNSYNQSQTDMKHVQDKIAGKSCPEGWKRFGCSCYFKSIEKKSWSDSRRDCQSRGSHLIIFNSKEEQDFAMELNNNGEFWIGLWTVLFSTKLKWTWVDGSPLKERFWATGELGNPKGWLYVSCCDQQLKLTQSSFSYKVHRHWICEK